MLQNFMTDFFFMIYQSNGVIVVAFGYDNTNDIMYPTNQVTLYDTTRDIIYTQNISGTPPQARVSAKSVLGITLNQ